jgi:hypothetical protein
LRDSRLMYLLKINAKFSVTEWLEYLVDENIKQ